MRILRVLSSAFWLADGYFKNLFPPYKIEASNALTYLFPGAQPGPACEYRETKNSISVWLRVTAVVSVQRIVHLRVPMKADDPSESRQSFEPKRTIFWLKADDLMKADDPILDVVLTKSRRSWSKRTIFFHRRNESRRSYFGWIFDSKQTILTHAFWYESGRSFLHIFYKLKQTILTNVFLWESGRS